MRFLPQKRRATPSVIIVSLVDVLMVVLIFLVVSTTFKDAHAYIEMAASKHPDGIQEGDVKPVLITIPHDVDHLLINGKKITFKELEANLKQRAAADPALTLSIEADGKADFAVVVKVRDIAQDAGIKNVNAFVQEKPKP